MTSTQMVALGVRLFAVWLAIYVLRSMPGIFLAFRQYDQLAAQVFSVVVAVMLAAIVVVLWVFPLFVARRLLPSSAVVQETSSPEAWFAMGCALIGIWVLTQALPALARYVVIFALEGAGGPYVANWHYGAIYHVAEAAIGIWLLLGAKGVRKLVQWARSAGGP